MSNQSTRIALPSHQGNWIPVFFFFSSLSFWKLEALIVFYRLFLPITTKLTLIIQLLACAFYILYIYVCSIVLYNVGVVHAPGEHVEAKEQLCGAGSLIPLPCGFQEFNLGCQACKVGISPADSSHQPCICS